MYIRPKTHFPPRPLESFSRASSVSIPHRNTNINLCSGS